MASPFLSLTPDLDRESQKVVTAGLLPTSHCFDPTIPPSSANASASEPPSSNVNGHASSLMAPSATSIKRASSLNLEEHSPLQRPRLISVSESSQLEPVPATLLDEEAPQERNAHRAQFDDEPLDGNEDDDDQDDQDNTEINAQSSVEEYSDSDSDASELQELFHQGPLQWLRRQREQGTSARDVLDKLRVELPPDFPVEDEEELWEVAVLEVKDLLRHFARSLQMSHGVREGENAASVLEDITLEGVGDYIKSGKCKNIILMTGAGISTAAGIPDFRSPGTGLYHNLQKYDLPYPQAIFEIDFFKKNPVPFVILAKELYPGTYKPTVSHYFSRMLAEKGLLLRHYTQNIDTLERVTGIEPELLVEAHGSFNTAHCIACKKEYTPSYVKELIYAGLIPMCEESECRSWIKPDIVFFGEGLPSRFTQLVAEDFPKCDLLIVAGTSLKVQPFASIIDMVRPDCPRLLLNKESCGEAHPMMRMLGVRAGFEFNSPDNARDVQYLGACDDAFLLLAEMLGWKEELETMVAREHTVLQQLWDEEALNREPCDQETQNMHISVDDFKLAYMAEKERRRQLGQVSEDEDDSDDSSYDDNTDDELSANDTNNNLRSSVDVDDSGMPSGLEANNTVDDEKDVHDMEAQTTHMDINEHDVRTEQEPTNSNGVTDHHTDSELLQLMQQSVETDNEHEQKVQ